jgi:hypothetical protein
LKPAIWRSKLGYAEDRQKVLNSKKIHIPGTDTANKKWSLLDSKITKKNHQADLSSRPGQPKKGEASVTNLRTFTMSEKTTYVSNPTKLREFKTSSPVTVLKLQ